MSGSLPDSGRSRDLCRIEAREWENGANFNSLSTPLAGLIIRLREVYHV